MPVTSTRQEIATETRDGKTYKITKTISRVTNLVKVPHSIAVRKLLKKYGNASNDSPGPESNSTTIGERVVLKMGIVGEEVDPDLLLKEGLQKLGQQKILCRVCKGDHWTSKYF